MLTKQIDVKEAQTRLQELLSQIASGVEWVLTDRMTPVDRLLVAQDIVEKAVLVSGDPNIAKYPVRVVW